MIIINGTQLDNAFKMKSYDFKLVHLMRVEKYKQSERTNWNNIRYSLEFPIKILFELNYIKVNPRIKNDIFLKKIAEKIRGSGVGMSNVPGPDDMRLCYNPIGDLGDIVRFYITEKLELVFLSPSVKLKIIN